MKPRLLMMSVERNAQHSPPLPPPPNSGPIQEQIPHSQDRGKK